MGTFDRLVAYYNNWRRLVGGDPKREHESPNDDSIERDGRSLSLRRCGKGFRFKRQRYSEQQRIDQGHEGFDIENRERGTRHTTTGNTMMVYQPNTRLSTNFIMREVARSNVADRWGIDNTPSAIVLRRAEDLAKNILQPVRNKYGISFSPNSWYRCEQLERIIAKNGFERWCNRHGYSSYDARAWVLYLSKKQHPTGMAADIEIPGVNNDRLFDWIKDNLKYDQLIREFRRAGDPASGWVHVSFNADGNRMQAFQIG